MIHPALEDCTATRPPVCALDRFFSRHLGKTMAAVIAIPLVSLPLLRHAEHGPRAVWISEHAQVDSFELRAMRQREAARAVVQGRPVSALRDGDSLSDYDGWVLAVTAGHPAGGDLARRVEAVNALRDTARAEMAAARESAATLVAVAAQE